MGSGMRLDRFVVVRQLESRFVGALFALSATVLSMAIALPALAEQAATEHKPPHEAATPAGETDSSNDPHSLRHSALFVFRQNPLGITATYDAGYRYRLFDSDSVLLADSYVGAGLAATLTPAFGKIGIVAEAEPLAVLNLSATYELVGYFGAFGHLQSFQSTDVDFSDRALSEGGDAGRDYRALGRQLTIGGTLQAMVGPVAARSTANLSHFDMDLREGDSVYYDITLDILVPRQGWVYTNDADILYLGVNRLVTGVRHTYTRAFYGNTDGSASTHRLGPLIAYQLSDRSDGPFAEPTLLCLTGWWLSHPYRQGQEVSALMPYVVFAFAFTGDFL